MKKVKISTPDGKTLALSVPEDATPDAIRKYAASAVEHYKSRTGSTGVPEPLGMPAKVWGAMNKPSEMSREGLTTIAQSEALKPNLTGNLATDVIRGTPQIAAETLAEVAPSFIDAIAIATGGAGMAAKGAGMAAGKLLPKMAPMLEAGSGLGKGTLVAAFKDPKMIMGFGAKLKASALYNEIKQGASVPAHLRTNAKVVSDAMNKMAKGYTLTAPDAFQARKAVNALMKSKQYPMDDLIQTKEGLEAMVFSSVKQADQMYVKALRGESMHHISRLNKNGTSGPISAAIMAKMPFLAPFMSPAVQGASASAAGAVSQMPASSALKAGAMVSAGLDRLKGKKARNRGKR